MDEEDYKRGTMGQGWGGTAARVRVRVLGLRVVTATCWALPRHLADNNQADPEF